MHAAIASGSGRKSRAILILVFLYFNEGSCSFLFNVKCFNCDGYLYVQNYYTK